MQISFQEVKNGTVIVLSGRLDSLSSPAFDQAIEERMLTAAPGAPLIIDFQAVEYISSAGLQSLLVAARKAEAAFIPLFLVALQKAVKDVFRITEFDTIFEIYESAEDVINGDDSQGAKLQGTNTQGTCNT